MYICKSRTFFFFFFYFFFNTHTQLDSVYTYTSTSTCARSVQSARIGMSVIERAGIFEAIGGVDFELLAVATHPPPNN